MSATPATPLNYWPQSACARAFWGQHELPPYRQLLADTAAWLDPRPGESWLDLGCGSGRLTEVLWEKSAGAVARVVATDCAAANERAFQALRERARPAPPEGAIRFVVADFSNGLPGWGTGEFDGVVSGLSLQYAECYSEELGRWTTAAYDRVLAEVCRVLRPGGRFVFSVNVPDPAWGKVAWHSLAGVFHSPRPSRYLQKALRMWSYGGWLTREARRGRFHYLPLEVVRGKLAAAGFTDIEHRLSYAGQAYLFRCRKPA